MIFFTTIGYHDAFFEVEVVLNKTSSSEAAAEQLGNHPNLYNAVFYKNKLVVGTGNESFVIDKKDNHLYQFRVCRLTESELQDKNHGVSDEDYDNISWDEALEYIQKEYKKDIFPFSLESYYYSVRKEQVVFH